MGLTVAIDTAPLLSPRTGVGRFVALLVSALDALPGRPIDVAPYVMSIRARLPPGTRRLPFPARAALRAWARMDVPRDVDRRYQVLHGPNYIVPPTSRPTVVSVHDCWFLRNPRAVNGAVRLAGQALRRAASRGVLIHVPSQHTANEVRDLLGTDRIAVLPLGAPPVDEHAAAPSVPGLNGRPYVVATATREPRKNLPRLVDAFGAVAADHPDLGLVLAGPDGPDGVAIDDAIGRLPTNVRRRVVILPYVTDPQRDALIRGAAALAFPSLDEGWGFPALEAMALGTPVVAARAGSLPEVCGAAAAYVDPLDVDSIAAGLGRVLSDPALASALVAAGRARVASYAPSACAAAFAALYRRLADEGPRPVTG